MPRLIRGLTAPVVQTPALSATPSLPSLSDPAAEHNIRTYLNMAGKVDGFMGAYHFGGQLLAGRLTNSPAKKAEYIIFEGISSKILPTGCESIIYTFDPTKRWDYGLVQCVTIIIKRNMYDVFCRGGVLNSAMDARSMKEIFDCDSMPTVAQRPIHKIRFPGHEYFVPEHNFVYIGYGYR